MKKILFALAKFEPKEYKKRTITIWNEVAPRYHKRWASTNAGPFQSTQKLVTLAGIKKGDQVLDIACGTGVVTKKVSSRIGNSGKIVSFDISNKALSIAKKFNSAKKNIEFIQADAETVFLKNQFDVITCQYALFFFPNSKKALCNAKRVLKKDGILAVSVHGHNTPFFSCILEAVMKFIPNYVPPGAPNLDRFGSQKALKAEIKNSGFSNIKVKTFVFKYSPGKFSDYWNNYLKYVAKPLKEKLDKLSAKKRAELRELVKQNVARYTKKNEKIVFPWEVIVLTAKK